MNALTRRLAAALLLLAATVAAQSNGSNWNAVTALTMGTDVRVSTGARTVSGKIDRASDSLLALTVGKAAEWFDRQQVLTVSVKKGGHRKRNALIGLAVGAGAGLAIGLAARPGPNQIKVISAGAVVGGLTAAGAIVGAIVGVIIPSGGWRQIYQK
jgi:hypothetical protein